MSQAEKLGISLKILDIGGGFPVDYSQQGFDIYQFCEPIRSSLATLPAHIKLLAEPGRFISASCMTSVSSVMGKAIRNNKQWYYLDDGLYGTYNGVIHDQIEYPISTPYNSGVTKECVLSGPTCDSFDLIRENI